MFHVAKSRHLQEIRMGAICSKCCLCYCFKICVCSERCLCPLFCRSLCECCEFADCCEVEEEEDHFAFAKEDENSKSDERGEVTLVYANGDSYKGQISNGKRHGLGEMTLADGTKLRGYFKDDEYLGSNSGTDEKASDSTDVMSEQETVPDSTRSSAEDRVIEQEFLPRV